LTTFYPLLTLVSIAIFGFLGWYLGRKRNRNALLWLVMGAFLPPVLIVLLLLEPLDAAAGADEGELDEG
jgi:hypothetical protein